MSRRGLVLVLAASICLSQTVTFLGMDRPHVYFHSTGAPRLSLMSGLAIGLLTLIFRARRRLSMGECLLLTIGTAGGLANLIDLWRMGGVADFIPLGTYALASPGDFLIALGFLGFLPVSLRQARNGCGFFALYGQWRDELRSGLTRRVALWLPGGERS